MMGGGGRACPALISHQEFLDALARELGLRDEAACAGAAHERAEVRGVAAGHEDHGRRIGMPGDPGRDVEAVDVGELHVEQHELGLEPTGLFDRAGPIHRLADDVEALALEQHASAGPKGRVVVDDKDGAVHRIDSRHRTYTFTYGWPYNTYRAFY